MSANFGLEPGARIGPPAVGSGRRNAKYLGGLLAGQGGKESQFDELGLEGIAGGQLRQGVVEREQFLVLLRGGKVVEILALPIATVFVGVFAPRSVDENATHRRGSGAEEMLSIRERSLRFRTDQAQVGFVNQGGGVERLSRLFVSELPRGETA